MVLSYRELQAVLRNYDLPRHYKRQYLERILSSHQNGDYELRDSVIQEAIDERGHNKKKKKPKKSVLMRTPRSDEAGPIFRQSDYSQRKVTFGDSGLTFSEVIPKIKGLKVSKNKIQPNYPQRKIAPKQSNIVTELFLQYVTVNGLIKEITIPPLDNNYDNTSSPLAHSLQGSNSMSPAYYVPVSRNNDDAMDKDQLLYDTNVYIDYIDQTDVNPETAVIESEFYHNNEGDIVLMDGTTDFLNDSHVWTDYPSLLDSNCTWDQVDLENSQSTEEIHQTDIDDTFPENQDQSLVSFSDTDDSALDTILDLVDEHSISTFDNSIDVSECGIARTEVQCRCCMKAVPTYALETHLRTLHATYIYKLCTTVWNFTLSVKDLQSRPDMETCRMFDCEGKLMLLFFRYEEPDTLKAIILCTPTKEDSFEYQVDLPRIKLVTKNIISGRNFTWDQKPRMIVFKNALMYDKPFEACGDYLKVNLKQLGLQPIKTKQENGDNWFFDYDIDISFDVSYGY